jgi:hypothetical protein
MKATMFKDNMLKAVLENRKTQTRRLDGLQEINKNPDEWEFEGLFCDAKKEDYYLFKRNVYPFDTINIKAKYQINDIVGIKENFEILHIYDTSFTVVVKYLFNNDEIEVDLKEPEYDKILNWKKIEGKKSKLFMFDSLIRHKIKITNIRPERIQNISGRDCIGEGINTDDLPTTNGNFYSDNCIEAFKNLWDTINKKRGYGFDKNNWVFAYEFKRINK